jgi:nucleotide-binding universal stress UspA family protein
MTGRVVAGVSSFATRLPVVRWAAGEAAGRGAGLRLVTAHAGDRADREAALGRLAGMAAAVRAGLPGLDVRTELVTGPPAAVLREAAADAALLVVGAGDASPFTEAIVGSVPGDLLTTTPCPLAVAPRREWTTPASAPVVVAVDGRETARAALAYAFAAASRSGRPLTVLRFPPGADPPAYDLALPGFAARYPGVAVTTATSRSDTADALVTAARTAAQLVLAADDGGRYGAGQFGSVRRTLIRRTGCPVVVPGSGASDRVGGGASSCVYGRA